VTIGLLAKPQTPRGSRARQPGRRANASAAAPPPRPETAASAAAAAESPPPSPPRPLLPFAFTPLLVACVKRTSAYVQPRRFASPSAMSARPLNFDSSGLPFGDCASRSATRSPDAMTSAEAPVYLRKSRREGCICISPAFFTLRWGPTPSARAFAAYAARHWFVPTVRSVRPPVPYTAGETDVI
jgi:hypothetical protein